MLVLCSQTMIFEIERHLRLEESNQNLGKDLLAENSSAGTPKTTWLRVTLNDKLNSRSEVRAISYTTL